MYNFRPYGQVTLNKMINNTITSLSSIHSRHTYLENCALLFVFSTHPFMKTVDMEFMKKTLLVKVLQYKQNCIRDFFENILYKYHPD